MLRFVGCDVHKRTAVFSILLEDGTLFASYTVPVTREGLMVFAERQLKKEDRLAMEATTNTWAVAAVLRPFVEEVVIGNPLRVRAIAEAKIDKVDSRVLAELLRCDYLPKVWQPDTETQRLRRLTHRRAALVSDRTRLKNRLHSILHHGLIPLPEYDLFSKRGTAWLREIALPAPGIGVAVGSVTLVTWATHVAGTKARRQRQMSLKTSERSAQRGREGTGSSVPPK